jgi:UDP-arabinose 4-epimerase
MNILVTGGAGYVGSHACKALAERGHLPITFDNLSRGNRWAIRWGPFEKGDIADVQQVRRVLKKYRPSALMHFAAYAYVAESVEQPLLYYRNNFVDTVALLQTVVDFSIIPVVFSSSCAVYQNESPSMRTILSTHQCLRPFEGFCRAAVSGSGSRLWLTMDRSALF